MSLVERSRLFAASAAELDSLRKAASLVTAVGTRANQFETALGKLRVVAGQLNLLREQGVSVNVDISPTAGFCHHLATLREAIADDPAAATVPDISVKTLSPLSAFTNSLAAASQSAWAAHVESRVPSVRSDLLQVLGRIPTLKARVEQFRTLLSAAQARGASIPTDAGEVSAFEKAVTDCHAAWAALDANEVPAGVVVFIQQATSMGASLDRLTDEVSAWLSEHKLQDSFVIRAR